MANAYMADLQLTAYTGGVTKTSMMDKLPANIVAKILHDKQALATKRAVIQALSAGPAKSSLLQQIAAQEREFAAARASYKKLARYYK